MIHKFSKLLGVTPEQIIEKNNRQAITEIRFLYAKLRHSKQGYNYSEIGREIKRTPATIMHAVNRVDELLSLNDAEVLRKWNIVKSLRE